MIYWTVIIEYLYKNGFTIPVHQTSSKESREWKRSVIFEKFYTYLIVFFNITLYSLDNSKWTILYTKKNKYDEHIKFCPLFLVKYIPRIRILHLHPPKIQTLAPPLPPMFFSTTFWQQYSLSRRRSPTQSTGRTNNVLICLKWTKAYWLIFFIVLLFAIAETIYAYVLKKSYS